MRRIFGILLVLCCLAGCGGGGGTNQTVSTPSSSASTPSGGPPIPVLTLPQAVFTTTDDATDNRLLTFLRGADGRLLQVSSTSAGGQGTGGNINSQGSLIHHPTRPLLFTVNGGSNTITSFLLTATGPILKSVVPSGGTGPMSVTAHGNLLYVVNATAPGNISGFTIADDGVLQPLSGSTAALSAPDVQPAQVSFSPDSRFLIVTEMTTNLIDVFPLDADGRPGPLTSFPAAAMTPYGFAFDANGHLLVDLPNNDIPNLAQIASYNLSASGDLTLIQGPLGSNQSADCWLAVCPGKPFAYAVNADSNTITGWNIAADGTLTLHDADGVTATTSDEPLDIAITPDGRFAYVLAFGSGAIDMFAINDDGSLTSLGALSGVPTTSSGLVAR